MCCTYFTERQSAVRSGVGLIWRLSKTWRQTPPSSWKGRHDRLVYVYLARIFGGPAHPQFFYRTTTFPIHRFTALFCLNIILWMLLTTHQSF